MSQRLEGWQLIVGSTKYWWKSVMMTWKAGNVFNKPKALGEEVKKTITED